MTKRTTAIALSGLVILAALTAGCRRPSRKAAWSDEEIIRRFNQVYYLSGILHDTRWLGVKVEQNPCDLWAMQEIITEIKPDVLIETGTWRGGSALYYATVMGQVHPAGKVVTIDIKDYADKTVTTYPAYQRNVTFILGSSVAPETLAKVKELIAPNDKVMVTLDSLHTKKHVLEELRLYAPLVSVGSYLVVQDTNIHGHPVSPKAPEGPMEAVTEFLRTNDGFEVDSSRMKFLLTFHPNGYLKRVR